MASKPLLPDAWVLWDPIHPHVNSGGDLFRRPDGTTTEDLADAEVFNSEDEARQKRDSLLDAGAWEPRYVSDFPIRKKP